MTKDMIRSVSEIVTYCGCLDGVPVDEGGRGRNPAFLDEGSARARHGPSRYPLGQCLHIIHVSCGAYSTTRCTPDVIQRPILRIPPVQTLHVWDTYMAIGINWVL